MANTVNRKSLVLVDKIYDELKELAAKDYRTLSGTVEYLLKFYKENNKLN